MPHAVSISHDHWASFVRSFSKYSGRKYDIGALLRCATKRELVSNVLRLTYDHRSLQERMVEELESEDVRKVIRGRCHLFFGETYDVQVVDADMTAVYGRAMEAMGLTLLPQPPCGCAGSHIDYDLGSPCWQTMNLVEDLQKRGVTMWEVEGPKVRYKPKSVLTQQDKSALKRLKPHILGYLRTKKDVEDTPQ